MLKKRYAFRHPYNMLLQHEQETDHLAEELDSKARLLIKFKNELLGALAGRLNALNPLGILERGYSITIREKDNKIVKDAYCLKQKDVIKTKLFKGEVLSRVESVSK